MLIGSYVVPGFVLHDAGFAGHVAASVEAPSEDLSGNTSSTDKAEKGIKAKKLNVSFSLQKQYLMRLQALIEIAEARDSNGDGIPQLITHALAMALRIRQATFGGLNVEDDVGCWHVSFTLIEHKSVPETAAKRGQTAAAAPSESFDALVKRMESSA